jgi:hypothetical protein
MGRPCRRPAISLLLLISEALTLLGCYAAQVSSWLDVSEQPICPIFIGQAVQEDSKNRLLALLDPSRRPQHRGATLTSRLIIGPICFLALSYTGEI